MTASVTHMVEHEPAPQQETELLKAAVATAEASRTSARTGLAAILIVPIVTALTAAAAIIGPIRSADIAASSAHAVALGENRRDAYSAYLGDLTDLHELLFDNLYWTGLPSRSQSITDKFWATAEPLQARLAADFGRAEMVTGHTAVRTDLELIDGLRGNMFYDFKCESGLQPCSPKSKITPKSKSTRNQIETHLIMQSDKIDKYTADLIKHATDLIGS